MMSKKVNIKNIDNFGSLVAHQLKSPVSSASMMIKTLLGEYIGTLTPQQKDLLLRVDKRLDEAIDSTQRMVSIEYSDKKDTDSDAYSDISSVIRHCHAEYLEEAAILGISFTVKIQIESVNVKIRRSALTEILNSLISNALKYTPSNGIVEINLSRSKINKAKVNLSIFDSGIGIPKINIDKIFEPYFRSASSQGSSIPGSGIGLAFVKTVLTKNNGSIKVSKSSHGGAKFTIELNIADNNIEHTTKNSQNKMMRIVIIGGVAAGPKAGSKLVRLLPDAEVTIIEKSDILSYSGCGLPYYVSGIIKKQSELLSSSVKVVRDPVFFHNIKNVNILNKTEAIGIDRDLKRVKIQNIYSKNISWVDYDKLVLATGSYPKIPNIEGIDLKNIFTLHGVHDAEGIKTFISGKKASDVVILGGGLIGLEMTEALIRKGCRVTIIETMPQILNIVDEEIAILIVNYLESHGVRVLTNTSVIKFLGIEAISSIVTNSGIIPADMVILSTGVAPQISLAKEVGLQIGITGAIKVNTQMMTSDPDIYAAGDCVEKTDITTNSPCYMPLGSTANKEGRIAALNISGKEAHFPGVLGTITCKVFDYCISRTGLTFKEAIEKGYNIVTSLTAGPDKEHFMKDAKTLMMKLIVDTDTKLILGAQTIGSSDGYNKIGIIATAMNARMTIDDISNLDLSYAPPYSLATDNLITAVNVVNNKIDKVFKSISSKEVYSKITNHSKFILLDVRSHKEYEELRIPGSTLIPLGVLRNRLFELDKNKEIVTFCSISLRGYEAALILQNAGFNNVKVMDGGITMWPYDITEGLGL